MSDDFPCQATSRFRVLATCAGFEPGYRGGGPVRSLANVVDTASDQVELLVLTRDRDLGSSTPYSGLSGRWIERGRARVFYLNVRDGLQWLRMVREVRRERLDLVYVNSLWSPVFSVLTVLACRLAVLRPSAILIAPRGELSPNALVLKAWKKTVFLKCWTPLLNSMNIFWHASNDREACQIGSVFPRARIEISQVQVSLPTEPLPASESREGPARFVFISRICGMKNLLLLLHALEKVSSPLTLDIYGPLEDAEYWARCQSVMERIPAQVEISYMGVLAPDEVRETFNAYDAFVFPTLGENFGHVVAESLSASCPVLCSANTSWTPVLEAGGGAVVHDLTPQALAAEVERVAVMTTRERLQRREAAGSAYRSWRRQARDRNILDHMRLRFQALSR
jgi:glycosyltransferase involved in cell wall biosynthesis